MKELYEICVCYTNGKEVDEELYYQIMSARNVIADLMNDSIIELYNRVEDGLGIDIPEERMECDDVAYLKLFNTAWTCELIKRGYNIRIIDETIYTPEYRNKHEFLYVFKKNKMNLIKIIVEKI